MGVLSSLPAAERADRSITTASSIVVFAAAWRTLRPLADRPGIRAVVPLLVEAAAIGIAVGTSGAWGSPFTTSLIVIAAIVGLQGGFTGAGIGVVVGVAAVVASALPGRSDPLVSASARTITPMVLVAIGTAAIAARYFRLARVGEESLSEVSRLSSANSLMVQLTTLARAGGVIRDVQTVAEEAVNRLQPLFNATAVSIVLREEASTDWRIAAAQPIDAVGTTFAPDALPPAIRALSVPTTLNNTLPAVRIGSRGLCFDTASTLVGPLMVRDEVIGSVVLERPNEAPFTDRDVEHLGRMLDVIGLTLDNSRWFRRLRSLGAEDERNRVARDVHDRLGSSVAALAFGLERLRARHPSDDEAQRLHSEARATVSELRDTLWHLRTGIAPDQPLASIGPEIARRHEERTSAKVTFVTDPPNERLSPAVELELLRLTQEALNNAARHADASVVDIRWEPKKPVAVLTIQDNGRGFDPKTAGRSDSYGLRGMRERADAIDAILDITSSEAGGTTIRVEVPDAR